MDATEIPEELLSPPETRLTGTKITKKPHPGSFAVSFCFLLGITLVTQLYWVNWNGWADYLPAVNRLIFDEGQFWRALTAVFIHADLGHLLSNLYMLGILSFFVYGYFGFWAYPVYGFAGATLVNLISVWTYPADVRLLGASGLVYLLGGFWLGLYFFIQRQHSWVSRSLRVAGMALMVFFPSTLEPTTSYRTHFIGFVVGLVMAIIYFYKNKASIREEETYKTIW